jgi:hypothetical protein
MISGVAGQKKDGGEPLRVFTMKIEPSLLETLRRVAKKERRSVSSQVKAYIDAGLEACGSVMRSTTDPKENDAGPTSPGTPEESSPHPTPAGNKGDRFRKQK